MLLLVQMETAETGNQGPAKAQPVQHKAEDEELLVYEEDVVSRGIQKCKSTLIAKILSVKNVNVKSLETALCSIWNEPLGFRLTELEPKFYQLFFDNEIDLERALSNGPWLFRNSWIVLHKWNRGWKENLSLFDRASTWVQFWGLPSHCCTMEMGNKIGEALGTVEDVGFFEMPGSSVPILKAKVSIDVNIPIRKGINIGNQIDGIHWIDFRYERFPLCCYFCAKIGHDEENCELQSTVKFSRGSNITSKDLGPWIRAPNSGRRIKTPSIEKEDHNTRKDDGTLGRVKQVNSEALLQKLAAMTVQAASQKDDNSDKGEVAEEVGKCDRNEFLPISNVEYVHHAQMDVDLENPIPLNDDGLESFRDQNEKTHGRDDVEGKELNGGKKWKRMARENKTINATTHSGVKRPRGPLEEITNLSSPPELDMFQMGKKVRVEESLLNIGSVGENQHGQQQ